MTKTVCDTLALRLPLLHIWFFCYVAQIHKRCLFKYKMLDKLMDKTFLLPPENKWNQVVKRLRKGSSFISKGSRTETDTKTQLFGQPLRKICPDDCSLPKPVTVSCLSILNVRYNVVSFYPPVKLLLARPRTKPLTFRIKCYFYLFILLLLFLCY